MTIISESAAQTKSLGKKFSDILEKQDIILLEGELGGGKTTFAKGLCQGLGYGGEVLSPSFTLVRRYEAGKIIIFHMDFYRLKKKNFSSIDIEEYLYNPRGIALIEWGKKAESYLNKYLIINFSFLGIKKRKLLVSQKGYGKDKLKNSL